MEEMIETKVLPKEVWAIWERAHKLNGNGVFEGGQRGEKHFKYQILDVQKERSFTILWKAWFVKLIFIHSVEPSQKGALISYKVHIKGAFAFLARFLLKEKIRKNIRAVLVSMKKELENKSVK